MRKTSAIMGLDWYIVEITLFETCILLFPRLVPEKTGQFTQISTVNSILSQKTPKINANTAYALVCLFLMNKYA